MKLLRTTLLAIVATQLSGVAQTNSKEFPDGDQSLVLAISEGFYPRPKHVVWEDGVFLIWPYPEKDPDFAFIGRYDPEDLEEALQEIEETNFHEFGRQTYVVPDSGWTEIYAATKSRKLQISWHEYLHPGYGGNVTTDEVYREFVKKWKRVRAAATRLTPIEIYLLMQRNEFREKKTFRGVNLEAPMKSKLPELEAPKKTE